MPKLFVVDEVIADPPLFVQRKGDSFIEEGVPPGIYDVFNTRKMPGTVTVTKLENAPVTANPSQVVMEKGQTRVIELSNLVSGGVTPYTFSFQNPLQGFSISESLLTIDGVIASVGTGIIVVVVTGANNQSNTIQVSYDIKAESPPIIERSETSIRISNLGTFPDYTFTAGETSITGERT